MSGGYLPIAPLLLAAMALVSVSSSASAQAIETGFLNRSVRVDGVEYRYQVYVPRDFSRAASWPVILALHGGEAYGSDGIEQTEVGRAPGAVTYPSSRRSGEKLGK